MVAPRRVDEREAQLPAVHAEPRARVHLRLIPLSEEQTAAAIPLYQAGKSLAAVRERLGVGTTAVHNTLIARGILRRDTHGRTR